MVAALRSFLPKISSRLANNKHETHGSNHIAGRSTAHEKLRNLENSVAPHCTETGRMGGKAPFLKDGWTFPRNIPVHT